MTASTEISTGTVPSQERLGALAERERIANQMVEGVVHRVFALGLSIQRVANEATEPNVPLQGLVDETDRIIDMIRDVLFPDSSL